MTRWLLIAYLSITTVLGPALCCCNLALFLPVRAKVNCCGKAIAKVEQPHHHDDHAEHVHHHSSHASEQSPATPHDHDPANCPCERHHAKLVAVPGSQGLEVERSSELSFGSAFGFVILPVADFRLFVGDCQLGTEAMPPSLFGREMLRAYQTMRC